MHHLFRRNHRCGVLSKIQPLVTPALERGARALGTSLGVMEIKQTLSSSFGDRLGAPPIEEKVLFASGKEGGVPHRPDAS